MLVVSGTLMYPPGRPSYGSVNLRVNLLDNDYPAIVIDPVTGQDADSDKDVIEVVPSITR